MKLPGPDHPLEITRAPARVAPDETRPDIDAIILHTDSGAGTSQREHWPANVSEPEHD